MPELPEVEYGRKVAASVVLDRTIVACEAAPDGIVFDGAAPEDVERALLGARVLAVHRKGKHLWFALDRRPWPTFHFGMTGAFRTPTMEPIVLEGGSKRAEDAWPPRFTKLWMKTDDGGELAMTNARRLGRIRLRDDPAREPPIGNLGFDPLVEMPKLAEFRTLLERRSLVLKALLLDQSFAAGVGNWIADEVLYQAKLDPCRRAHELTPDEQRVLHRQIKAVVKKAVDADADKDRFPKTWLFHRRWGKDADARTADGQRIEFIEIAGRTTAWVPTRQQ